MVIQAMLVVALVGVLLLFTRREHGVRMQVGKRLAFVAFIGVNLYGVLRPDDLTRLANHLGVGRGADLLLYGLAMSAILLVVNTGLRFRAVDRRFTELVRAFALHEAELRNPRPAPPATTTSAPTPLAHGHSSAPPVPDRMRAAAAQRSSTPAALSPPQFSTGVAERPSAQVPADAMPPEGVSPPARVGRVTGPGASVPTADALSSGPPPSDAVPAVPSMSAAENGSDPGTSGSARPEAASPAGELGPVPWSAAALRSAVPWSPTLARQLASSRPRSWSSRGPMPPGSASRRSLPSWRNPGSTDPDA